MNQNQQVVPFACDVIPLLEQEWQQSQPATKEKFLQFIEYHEGAGHPTTACMYRCGLVQLQQGYGTQTLTGMGMTDAQLREAVGV